MGRTAARGQARSVQVVVNGQPETLAPGSTIASLLAGMDLSDRRCAVEVNEQLIRRERHARHELHAGDRIEVVTLVGGG
ncbi:MAG: sulfur carrier protein ThiS [Planctomycetota bacterium]